MRYPHDATNEIFDLQRVVHARDFAFCEEDTFGIRALLICIPLLSERVALRSILEVLLPFFFFFTAAFCVVALAVGMRTCVTHGIAGSTGNSSFILAF